MRKLSHTTAQRRNGNHRNAVALCAVAPLREKYSFLRLILIVAMGVVVHAQVQTPSKTADDTTGTISGRVVNDSGQPLAGASLFVRAMNSLATPRNTVTDADGNFRLNGLEPALYTIIATAPAYATDTSASSTTYYRVGETVNLELVRGGVVTGTVTTSAGDPVIGVRVRAMRVRDAKGQTPRLASLGYLEQPTDDRGVYRIYGLLPGTYLVSAGGSSGGFASAFNPYDTDVPTYAPSSTRDNAAEITVRSGEESSADIRYRGEQGYSISGTVKIANTGAATLALRAVGNSILLASTYQPPGAHGFSFNGLSDGEYTLRAQEIVAAANVSQLASSATKRITIKGANVTGVELIPTPLASISGRVVLEPSKLPECQGKRPPLLAEMLVQLQRPEKDAEDEDGVYVGLVGGFASPDPSGALAWHNVRPGKYRFEPHFYARYWYLQSITMNTTGVKPQKIDAAANWTVTKSGEQLNNVVITIAQGAASLRGRLAVAEGASVQSGTNLYLIPAEPDKAMDVLRYFVTEVAADGAFALNNLPPGKYLALIQVNVDAPIATQPKLREPEAEAVAARAKLRRTAETKKTEIDLKPCQNVTDFQVKQ